MRLVALTIIDESTNGLYRKGLIDFKSGMTKVDKINLRWIHSFMELSRIVSRSHSGKLQLSPSKQQELEMEVARHLGRLKHGFYSRDLD